MEFHLLHHPPGLSNTGYRIAVFQHQLTTPNPYDLSAWLTGPGNIFLTSEIAGTESIIKGENFSVVFDTARGYIKSWELSGKPVLEQDPNTHAAVIPSFWRAPTDNDKASSLSYWERFGLNAMTSQLRDIKLETPNNEMAIITTTHFLSPPILSWGYTAETTYIILPEGSIFVRVTLTPSGSHPEHVPRVGLNLRLARTLDSVEWQGLGPGESYPDKRSAQLMGVWGKTVADMQTGYDVPQENGNRMATRWVEVSGDGVRLRAAASEEGGDWSSNLDREFSFVTTRHSAETLQGAAHPCDLVEEDATLLRLDAKVAGVGTAACGPGVREDLLVKVEEVNFEFVLAARSHNPDLASKRGRFSDPGDGLEPSWWNGQE